jgi:hypothetical protein
MTGIPHTSQEPAMRYVLVLRTLLILLINASLLLPAAGCRSRAPSTDPTSTANVRLYRGQVPRCPYEAVGPVTVETALAGQIPDPTSRQRLEQKLAMEVRTQGGHAAIDLQESQTGRLFSLTAVAIRFSDPECRD